MGKKGKNRSKVIKFPSKTMPSKGDSLLDLELLKNGIVDGGLIGQMHDLDKKVSLSKNILESLPERMKEAKSRFVSAMEDHKKFCAHAAEAAKSEGRTVLSASEREQLQSHVDNIKQTKIEILNLKKEMIQAVEFLKS